MLTDVLGRYSAPLYVDMTKRVMRQIGGTYGPDAEWEADPDYAQEAEASKVWIGKVSLLDPNLPWSCRANSDTQVPIMLRSSFCILHGLEEKDLFDLNECPYDQVGYLSSWKGSLH